MKCVIAVIDLGTTNIKVTLIGEQGEILSLKKLPTPVVYGVGTMEIDPVQLWQDVLACCRGAVYVSGEKVHVDAVVISSMAASFIPLDKDGNVLSPAIGWGDSRATPYMECYMEEFLNGHQIAECGQYPLPMYAGFKLQWLREHAARTFEQMKKWVNVNEFIYYRLLGGVEYVTDYSIASRTMLLDVYKHTWNSSALEYFSLDRSFLPRILAAGTVVGTAARETWDAGLSPDTKVILGGHDHMCAVAGVGITSSGTVLNSTGTSEAVVALIRPDCKAEEVASKWINLECAVLPKQVAGVCYVGASGRVYQSANESLNKYAESEYFLETGLVFLPPQRAQMPSIKGELRGISPVFDSQQIHRAMRDGMYYECRRGMERILGAEKTHDMTIRCVGGHTKNHFEMQMKSDAMGCAIEIIKGEDMASRGAYILAGTGCGWYDSIEETSKWLYEQSEKERIIPNMERSRRHDEIYQKEYLSQFPNGIYSL